MRSIVSTGNGGRPVFARGQWGSTICTNAAQGTTRSISSKNLALRVFFVERFRPRPSCFMAVLRVVVTASRHASHGPVLQSFPSRWAAVCAMRRAPQDGQNPRRLQLKVTSLSGQL